MHNLVNKFTPDTDVMTDDEGVVAIEYVLVASAVAAGVIIVFAAGSPSIWSKMNGKLSGLFGTGV